MTTRPLAPLLLLAAAIAGCSESASPPGDLTLSEQHVAASRDPNPITRTESLARIGLQQYGAGDRGGAESTLREASGSAAQIADSYQRSIGHVRAAAAQAGMRDEAAARTSLNHAQKTAESITSTENQIEALGRIATIYSQELHDRAAAAKLLQDAERLAAEVQNPQDKNAALLIVLSAYATANKTADVDRLRNLAGEAIATIQDPRAKVDALAALGATLSVSGRRDDGLDALDNALAAARKIDDPYIKAHALLLLASQFGKAGSAGKDQAVVAEAEQAAASIPAADLRKEVEQKLRQLRRATPNSAP